MSAIHIENKLIFDKFLSLPESMKQEAADFIEFLTSRYQKEKRSRRNISPPPKKIKKRESNFGSARGLIIMGDDFDEPLEDFKEYM